jgi:hypothetical protein
MDVLAGEDERMAGKLRCRDAARADWTFTVFNWCARNPQSRQAGEDHPTSDEKRGQMIKQES